MNVRLNIDGTDVGFDSNLPVSVNKSVADIREPGKRNSGYSKTIRIPGTPEANKLFEFIFQVNVESNNFNPNIKTPASYFVNEVEVFKGDLQLLTINKTFNGLQEQVEYECSIVGENGNLFLDITGLYLTDIDMSDLDHPFTYASGLFNPTLGEGYCYPYIDYGLDPFGSRVGRQWTFEHLKPAIFEKEYIDRIFADAGYTYTSNYLTSTYAKSIIIPDVNAGALQLPAATVINNQFLARLSATDLNSPALTPGTTWTFGSAFQDVMSFDDDSSNTGGVQYFDPGGVYNTGTFRFTPGINGTFQISARAIIGFDVNPPAGTLSMIGNFNMSVHIQKSTNGGSSWSNAVSAPVFFTGETSFPLSQTTIDCVLPPQVITQPCIFRVLVELFSVSFTFLDVFSAPISTGSASIDFDYSGTFGAILSTANLPSGSTVVMNDTIPQNVTQLDFLTSIIKLENLYFEPDRDNPRNYIIEPREDFIEETDPKDWSGKMDYSKPIKINPMGELDVKRYVFTYKSDKDHFNKMYEEEFKEVYGTETIDVESDFVRGEKRIECVFSATPTTSADDVSPTTDIVAARLFSTNGDLSEVSPMKCNIRRLYWGGMISCSTYELIPDGYYNTVTSSYTGSSPLRLDEYPYAGHVDHPMDPTVDLLWDNPFKLYWIFPQQTYTNNQRYGARWSKFISEITDRDSKIVTAYFYLTERDIYEFSFRKKIFFDGTYYFVNEIKDYDPQDEKSVPVELLKLQTGPTFTPLSIGNINDVLGGDDDNNSARTGANMNMRGNYGAGKSFGTNNINNDPFALVIGNNNNVG